MTSGAWTLLRGVPLLSLLACASAQGRGTAEPRAVTPNYVVTVRSISPPLLSVRAQVKLESDTLHMETTRPGDHPDILRQGWPALVRNLRVIGDDGQALVVEGAGDVGWTVQSGSGSQVTLAYDVDYGILAAADWPAPREAAYADGTSLLIVARSLFVGTRGAGPATVRLVLPPEWLELTPWPAEGGYYRAPDFDRLTANALVFTRTPARTAAAGGFAIQVAGFDGWQGRRDLAERVLTAHAATFSRLFGTAGRQPYLSVFLEGSRLGGEAYLDSYVMQGTPAEAPERWGRIVGHELFHFWNGQRLRGADYTASQWFQEGVTEYVALLSMAAIGLMDEADVLAQLSERLRAGQAMEASLAASGNRKNAAFYGKATVTAFLLDLLVRAESGGEHGLPDLLRALWASHGEPGVPYEMAELYDAAGAAAGADLRPFFRAHVEGADSAGTGELLATAGLKLTVGPGGELSIVADPEALPAAVSRRRAVMTELDR